MKKILIASCVMTMSVPLYAGGYRVAIQGQKALGMGHAGVAMNTSAETVFFNPAAMTGLDAKMSFVAGVTGISSENFYQNEDTLAQAETDTGLGTPIGLYGTYRHSDTMVFGLGIYTPYGSAVEWEKDWVGSHLVNNIELSAVYIQPTLAYQVNEQFSLGFGPILAIGGVEFNRNLSPSLQDENGARANATIEDSGIIEFGFNLGVHYQATKNINFGLNYRSEITMGSEGDATFSNIPQPLRPIFQDGGYKADLPLPAELTVGISHKISDVFTLAVDYNYAFWDVYENLTIEFDSIADPSRATSINPRNYQNSSTLRIGGEYAYKPNLTLRAGSYLDESPISDGYFAPETPRTDSIGFTAGFTYKFQNNLELDMSYLFLHFDEIDNSYDFNDAGPFEGSYKVNVSAFGIGLSYSL